MFRPNIEPPSQRPPRTTPAEIREPDVSDAQIDAARDAERQKIEAGFAERRRKLEEDQKAELSRPAEGTDRDEIRQRHEQERHALEEQEKVERRIAENRLQKKIVKPGRRGRPGGDHGHGQRPG